MIQWTLSKNRPLILNDRNFIECCLIARKNHIELNDLIIGLLFQVADLGRSRMQNKPSNLVELIFNILPHCFENLGFNNYEYVELIDDILESHHFHFEKERIDK